MTAPTGDPTWGKGLDVATTARELLDWVVEHFAAAAAPLPARQYVAPGEPAQNAWDCEQVSVGLGGIGWGSVPDAAPASPKTGRHASVASTRFAIYTVEIVRCVPALETTRNSSRAPAAEDIDDAGMTFLRDAGLLSQAIARYAAHLAAQSNDLAGRVQPGAVDPVGPQGKFASVVGTLQITAGNLK